MDQVLFPISIIHISRLSLASFRYSMLEQARTVKISTSFVFLADNWATAGDVWCKQDSESGSPKSENERKAAK
jgi:hypothetical protein